MGGLFDHHAVDWELLARYGFDRPRFEDAAARVAAGTLSARTAILTGKIEAAEGVIDVLPTGATADAARAAGEAALRAGQVASVVLNGGMATRFGNVVKGTVEVFPGWSFLALKARDLLRASATYGAPIPLVLMNSFATEAATAQHFARGHNFGLGADELLSFHQSIALRLTPAGDLFTEADGAPSYYAPGHGDFFAYIRRSGVLAELVARGVRCVLFANVDNLGATVDPLIIGHHILSGCDMSAEVTAKRRTASGAWDKGGAPASVDGLQRLVEGFRLPPDLPPDYLPDFSTNNFVFSTAALERPIELEWFAVEKKVDGRPAVQLESITAEATGLVSGDGPLLSLALLRVPRDGPTGRFFPIKEREDLDALRDAVRSRLLTGWRLRDGTPSSDPM